MASQTAYRCPVCRAPFRGTQECSRCGADLTRVMSILAKAQISREHARAAIRSGQFHKAHVLAKQAQELHQTEQGRRLLLLTGWLGAGRCHER
ncbi:MAG: hypothetical protein J7M32_13255 [Deltaproteobacteria bacterium]|nr:hypothetical protein [Deltaproteobacteria bacterium]OQX65359.1 MAG: hypothetical protein B5M55_04140 [Desulfococcus sp. 4484_242]